jgi:hypothetical protein
MDNCGGQNKNNHVLRLANILVEAGYFHEVNFVFYVVGHTKNICDRWFNTLKKNYLRKNIYTFEQLCDSWNEASDRITLHEVTEDFFKYYYDFENILYDTITSGFCEPGHVYTVVSSMPTVLTIKFNLLNTYEDHVQDMKKDGNISDADRVHQLRSRILLETIPFPSIPEVKQIELFRKWRKVVPEEYWKYTCKQPDDDVLERHKKKQNLKAAAARIKKKETLIAGGAPSTKKNNKPKPVLATVAP